MNNQQPAAGQGPEAARKKGLWPYGLLTALVFIPLAWLGFALMLGVMRWVTTWPSPTTDSWLVLAAGIISVLPFTLIIADFLAARGGALDIRGVKIDFGTVALPKQSLALPGNIGLPGQIVQDSTPIQITATLAEASDQDIVVLDLGDGDEWWVSRLFVLAAGAARANRPRVLVFVGRKDDRPGSFLGYAEAPRAVRGILAADPALYEDAYRAARRAAHHVSLFGVMGAEQPVVDDATIGMYLRRPEYVRLGEASMEHILLDRLRFQEQNPQRLTLVELSRILGPYLITDAIDLGWTMRKQVTALLHSTAPYVALTRDGVYASLIERRAGESALVRQLVEQALGDDD